MPPTAIAILSNKGGVGKTHLATNLALTLAQRGKKVLLIDADWSSANVARKLGLQPVRTLRQFFAGECEVGELIARTPLHANLYLLAGSPGELAIANMDPANKLRMLSIFREITRRSTGDYIFFDLGAGVENRTLDTALAADFPLVVTTPQDVLLGYASLKALLARFIEVVEEQPSWFEAHTFKPWVIVNQVLEPGLGQAVVNTMSNLLLEYAQSRAESSPALTQYFRQAPAAPHPFKMPGQLSRTAILPPTLEIQVRLLGEVPYARESFITAELNRTPFMLAYPNHPAAAAIRALADTLTGEPETPVAARSSGFWKRLQSLVSP